MPSSFGQSLGRCEKEGELLAKANIQESMNFLADAFACTLQPAVSQRMRYARYM